MPTTNAGMFSTAKKYVGVNAELGHPAICAANRDFS